MGGVFSRGRSESDDGEANVGAYKYPSKSGNYFGSYFFMGGSVFEMTQPETFLFGDPNDLNFLSSRPAPFPYPLTYDNEPTRALRALVNVRKDSVRLVRVSNNAQASTLQPNSAVSGGAGVSDNDSAQSQLYNLEFTFDSDVRCAITIYYCAREEFRDGALHYSAKRGLYSETFRYKRGTNQLFSQPTHVLDANRIDEPIDTRRDVYPIVIHCVAECEDYAGHSHATICTIDRPNVTQTQSANASGGSVSSDFPSTMSLSTTNQQTHSAITNANQQSVANVNASLRAHANGSGDNAEVDSVHQLDGGSGPTTHVAASVKVVKQKQVIDGLVYVLEEIYGIENKISKQIQALRNGQPVDADAVSELGDTGMECVICMCDPRDTLILPCRHLCLCAACAENLRFQASSCPICRAPFRALLQIRALRRRPPPSATRMLTPSILVNDVVPTSSNSVPEDQPTSSRRDAANSDILQANRPSSPEIPPGYEIVSLVEALNGLTCPLTGAGPHRSSLIRGVTPVPVANASRFDAPGPSGINVHQRSHGSHASRTSGSSRPHSQHLNTMHRVVLNATVERDAESLGGGIGVGVGVGASSAVQQCEAPSTKRKYVPSELNNMNADEDDDDDEDDAERDSSARCAAAGDRDRDRDAVMMNIVHSNLDSATDRGVPASSVGPSGTGKLTGLDELVRDNESVTTECSELVSIAANLAREQAGPGVSVVYVHKPNVKPAAAAAAVASAAAAAPQSKPSNDRDSMLNDEPVSPEMTAGGPGNASWSASRPPYHGMPSAGYQPRAAGGYPSVGRPPGYQQAGPRGYPQAAGPAGYPPNVAAQASGQRPVYSSMSVESSDTSAMSGASEQDDLGWYDEATAQPHLGGAPCPCHVCAMHAPPMMGADVGVGVGVDVPPIGAGTHIHHAHQITTTCYSTTIHHGHVAAAYPGVSIPMGHAASMSHTHTTTMSVCCCAPPGGVPVQNVIQHAAVQHSVQHTSIVQHSVHHFDAAYPIPVAVPPPPPPPPHPSARRTSMPHGAPKAGPQPPPPNDVFLPDDTGAPRMSEPHAARAGMGKHRPGQGNGARLSLHVPRSQASVPVDTATNDGSVYGTCSAVSVVGSSTAATDGCSSAEQSAAGSLPETPDTNRDVSEIQRQLQTAAYLNQQSQAQAQTQFVLNVPRSVTNRSSSASQKAAPQVASTTASAGGSGMMMMMGAPPARSSASQQPVMTRSHHEVRQERIHEESDEDNENEAIEMQQYTSTEPVERDD